MRNRKSKIAIVILMCMLSSLLMLTAGAERYVATESSIDAEYSYTNISDEKASYIINELYGDASKDDTKMVTMANLLCIFGHSKETGVLIQTSHSYYSTSPKCREITSNVEYCTRSGCDYYTVTSQYEVRIGCH